MGVKALTKALTFLGDANGTAAHAHSQGINAGVDEVLGLSSCDHCTEKWGRSHAGSEGRTIPPSPCILYASPLPPMTWRLGYFSLMYLIMLIWKMEFPWEESWGKKLW